MLPLSQELLKNNESNQSEFLLMKLKSQQEIDIFLATTDDTWVFSDGHLRLDKNYNNYLETFSRATQIALISEKLDHHPTLIVDYNKLVVKIKTHCGNGITSKDFEFVRQVNRLLKTN